LREQVQQLGLQARERQDSLRDLRDLACNLLEEYAGEGEILRQKVKQVAASYDPYLRCACPPDLELRALEPLNAAVPAPALPAHATILAADGSQIPIDRHAEVLYGLINVGAIHFRLGTVETPQITVHCRLMYDETLFTPNGLMTEATLALMRDKEERTILAEMASQAPPPVITFTDGPVELWGGRDSERAEFLAHLEEYLESLRGLARLDATVAGYVDKPFASLVVRLLEVALVPPEDLKDIKERHPLHLVRDHHLFNSTLGPGQRSAVFALQSSSARQYQDELALHFFYLNVGREDHPWLARVEIPAWVAGDPVKLDDLHAVLVDQCRQMGGRPFPYLLHRAHETAVVSFEERHQVTQMIAIELRGQQVEVGEVSYKQSQKDLPGRTRY